jgi:hypothetical protein
MQTVRKSSAASGGQRPPTIPRSRIGSGLSARYRAESGVPDFFMFGDPHNNYYRGQVFYDDVKLEYCEISSASFKRPPTRLLSFQGGKAPEGRRLPIEAVQRFKT